MSELYSDDNGNRVILRHKGPAGRGFPAGGTTGQVLIKASGTNYDATWQNSPAPVGAAIGPDSAVDNNVAVFDGTTGKLLKNGGQPLSNYASVSLVATKQDKEAGKGLSQENFTTTLKDKLDDLSLAGFRGSFDSLSGGANSVDDFSFDPVPQAGDYCLIEVAATDVQLVLWDATNGAWVILNADAVDMAGQDIANAIFDADDAAVWDVDTCRIFTEIEKAQLAAHEALISAFTGSGTSAPTYVAASSNHILLSSTKTLECVSGSFTVTLPTAVGQTVDVTIKNSGGGTITVNTADGIQTIDGSISIELTAVNESLTLRSTGANWLLI